MLASMPPSFFGNYSSTKDKEKLIHRQSRGLEQFFSYIRDQVGLSILDLSGANQENVNFITNLGHKLYSEDFMRGLTDAFGDENPAEQANPGTHRLFPEAESGLQRGPVRRRAGLGFPGVHGAAPAGGDGGPAAADRAPQELPAGVLPRGGKDGRGAAILIPHPRFQFTYSSERGERVPVQLFNNRSLEKLFGRFESVKFFLTREQLREVIVKR